MLAIVSLIAPFFTLIAVGYIAGRRVQRPVEGLAWLNVFIVYLALPALFFQLLSKTPVETLASGGFVATTTASTFLVVALLFGLALLRRAGLEQATIQGLAGGYGNIGYMGPGLALAALGPGAAVPVALVFCFDNALHFILTPTVMAISRREGTAGTVALGVVRQIFGHPFILATLVGLGAAVFHLSPPAFLDRTLQLLAGAAAPCALFAMGVTLALRPLKRVPLEMAWIVPAKLVLHPLLVWRALSLTGPHDPVWVSAAVLLASLPTATNVFVLAQQYGVWTERASACILVSTVASVVTITLWLLVLTG